MYQVNEVIIVNLISLMY